MIEKPSKMNLEGLTRAVDPIPVLITTRFSPPARNIANRTVRNNRLAEGCHSMIYPEDANGIVLRRIAAQGKDLTKARNIDFTVIFAQGGSAGQFAEYFRELGYAVSVEETEPERDFPWNVIVVKHMVPTYEGITDFENELQSVADRWEGHNDGWGFFSEPIAN